MKAEYSAYKEHRKTVKKTGYILYQQKDEKEEKEISR